MLEINLNFAEWRWCGYLPREGGATTAESFLLVAPRLPDKMIPNAVEPGPDIPAGGRVEGRPSLSPGQRSTAMRLLGDPLPLSPARSLTMKNL